jgi:hypothetical protein
MEKLTLIFSVTFCCLFGFLFCAYSQQTSTQVLRSQDQSLTSAALPEGQLKNIALMIAAEELASDVMEAWRSLLASNKNMDIKAAIDYIRQEAMAELSKQNKGSISIESELSALRIQGMLERQQITAQKTAEVINNTNQTTTTTNLLKSF